MGMEVWRGSFEMGTAGYGMVWIMDGIAWGSGKGGCACTILFAMYGNVSMHVLSTHCTVRLHGCKRALAHTK